MLVVTCLLGLPSLSWADAGIPMLALVWPLAWLMFLPVVAVETWVATKALRLSLDRAMRLSLWANGVSTLAGIPLTWCLLLLLEMALLIPIGYLTNDFPTWLAVTVGAPWIAPLEGQGKWQVAVAGISLSVFFAATLNRDVTSGLRQAGTLIALSGVALEFAVRAAHYRRTLVERRSRRTRA